MARTAQGFRLHHNGYSRMTATLAGARTGEVKAKSPPYKYVSYWTFPRAHWTDVGKDNATGKQKIHAPALAAARQLDQAFRC